MISKVDSKDLSLFDKGLFDDLLKDQGEKPGDKKDAVDQQKRDPVRLVVPENISGRTAAGSSLPGILGNMDNTLCAAAQLALTQTLEQLGLKKIAELCQNSGGKIAVSSFGTIDLKYQETRLESGSTKVTQDDVRKACDEMLRKKGRDVQWVETDTVIDAGAMAQPQKQFDAVRFLGVTQLGSKLRYRRMEPYETIGGPPLKSHVLGNVLNIPISARLAKRLPAGSEFELIGEGSFSISPQMVGQYGYGPKEACLGLKGQIGTSGEIKGELAILVQRLPKDNKVLVKIRRAHGRGEKRGILAAFGLNLDKQIFKKIPTAIKSFLDMAAQRIGLEGPIEQLRKFFRAKVAMKSRQGQQNNEIVRLAFDLSDPKAAEAYEAIFMKATLGPALKLAQEGSKSVYAQQTHDLLYRSESGIAAALGKTKISENRQQSTERDGSMHIGAGDLTFHDDKYQRQSRSSFHEQSLLWEAVRVTPDHAPPEQFYHFQFTKTDLAPSKEKIEAFLGFSQALKIPPSPHTQEIANVLALRDEARFIADLYFKQTGISRLLTCTQDEAKKAFWSAYERLKGTSAVAYLPPQCAAIEGYASFMKKGILSKLWHRSEIQLLKAQIEQQTKTSAPEAVALFERAQAFSACLMKHQRDKNAQEFFTHMGELCGDDFMNATAALVELAGVENTLVHALSVGGGGLTLSANDEGEVLHPERVMNRVLANMA